MDNKLNATTETPSEIKQTKGEWNTADLGWPTVAALGILCLTYLIASKKIRSFVFGAKDKSVALNSGEAPTMADDEVHERVDKFIEMKHKVERRITGAQIRIIRGTMDRFAEIFPTSDPVAMLQLWSRFADELYLAAAENHVLFQLVPADPRYPDGEKRLDAYYVNEKIGSVREAHRRLVQKYDLPQWDDVAPKVEATMRYYLDRFVEIAAHEWGNFKENAETVAAAIEKAAPGGARRIRRLLESIDE